MEETIMKNKNALAVSAVMLAILMLTSLFWAYGKEEKPKQSETTISTELKKETLVAIDKGLQWLKTQQDEKGAFHQPIGMTGLAVAAFLRHPEGKYKESDDFLQKSIKYIISVQNPDGSIYDKNDQPALPNYNTSISLMALSSTKNPKYADVIKKAQNYIEGIQLDESEGITPDNKFYGGIGYGSDPSTRDMSNLSFALQGLKESGLPEDSKVWDKALKFLERCQNNSETNDQSSTALVGNDGGFVYYPGNSKAGNDEEGIPRSYASMTYAGLLSFIYANVDKEDPRVQAAIKWLKNHYTLDENYGMGLQGLYYNYHTMAKALSVYGEPIITDTKGIKHNWYEELARKLISLQKPEGYWVNEADRWMEADPVVVTAYAILALEAGFPK
ncbi:terpene cyclase/mutase family protein [Candidatus Poribacteria bacterium]|nr:terpene cyclase/mutase family protein [Candidatus Poribacteria bacterium]